MKKGTKVVVTACKRSHKFEIGEVIMACRDFKCGEIGVDFENKNGDCWYLDPDEYEFLEDTYLKLKKEKWFRKLLKINNFETLIQNISDTRITSYANYKRLPEEKSYGKAELLLEYKETLLKCKTPKTPKEICIEDIKNSDIIGFEANGYGKGHIVFIGTPYFAAISIEDCSISCNASFGTFYGNHHESQMETAVYLRRGWNNAKFYKFKTHKKLFKWLVK